MDGRNWYHLHDKAASPAEAGTIFVLPTLRAGIYMKAALEYLVAHAVINLHAR
jgi:hypothetical protein